MFHTADKWLFASYFHLLSCQLPPRRLLKAFNQPTWRQAPRLIDASSISPHLTLFPINTVCQSSVSCLRPLATFHHCMYKNTQWSLDSIRLMNQSGPFPSFPMLLNRLQPYRHGLLLVVFFFVCPLLLIVLPIGSYILHHRTRCFIQITVHLTTTIHIVSFHPFS